MKKIKLTRGKFAIVDDEEYEWLNKYKWYCDYKGYANRAEKRSETGRQKRKSLAMSRDIMKPPDGLLVDHINHNPLDNRKINLRICTISENMRNRKMAKNCKSGYKVVCFRKDRNSWIAYIKHSGRSWVLKHCKTKEDAALVYNEKAKELFGEFAYLNKIK